MKTLRSFLNCILTLIVAFALCADILFLGLSIGILNEKKIYKAMDACHIYDIVYDDFFENTNTDSNGPNLKDVVDKDTIKNILNNVVHYIYTSELNETDLSDSINVFVDAYSQTVSDSFSTYLNDYFDALKKKNYNFNSDIVLNTSEEDFCINALGLNLNEYISNIYSACGNDSKIFASIADDTKKQILDTAKSSIDSEVNKAKIELNEQLSDSSLNNLNQSDELVGISTAFKWLKHNMLFLRISATISMVFCILIMYLMYSQGEKYKLFSKIGIALLLNISFYSLFLYASKIVVNSSQNNETDYIYDFLNAIYNLFAGPFIFLTICCGLIMIFCYIMWAICRKINRKVTY